MTREEHEEFLNSIDQKCKEIGIKMRIEIEGEKGEHGGNGGRGGCGGLPGSHGTAQLIHFIQDNEKNTKRREIKEWKFNMSENKSRMGKSGKNGHSGINGAKGQKSVVEFEVYKKVDKFDLLKYLFLIGYQSHIFLGNQMYLREKNRRMIDEKVREISKDHLDLENNCPSQNVLLEQEYLKIEKEESEYLKYIEASRDKFEKTGRFLKACSFCRLIKSK